MPKHRMTVRTDDLGQFVGPVAADHRQLNPLVVFSQEVRDVVLVGDRVDVHTRVALLPGGHLIVTQRQHRRMTQLGFLHGPLHDDVVFGSSVQGDDDPVDVLVCFVVLRADHGDRALRLLRDLGRGGAQDRARVAVDPDGADTDQLGLC